MFLLPLAVHVLAVPNVVVLIDASVVVVAGTAAYEILSTIGGLYPVVAVEAFEFIIASTAYEVVVTVPAKRREAAASTPPDEVALVQQAVPVQIEHDRRSARRARGALNLPVSRRSCPPRSHYARLVGFGVTRSDAVQGKEICMTTENTPEQAAPDTIVLVHGLWVTPRSWEHWIEHYEGKGYRVIAPAYPGLEVEVEALNEDPSPIEALTIPGVVEHLEGVMGKLEEPPIIMGHSAGGLFTQILLDHGYGAAGVAIDSAPAEGVRVTPVSQIRVFFPILRNPANRHKAVGFTKEQFHYAFANTLSREDSDAAYERYHIPAPGSFVWAGPLANFTPGHQDTYVNFRNEERVPLLFIAGGEDNLMPPAVNQSNVKHYRHVKSATDYKEFEGRSHYTVGQDGWEEVADYALEWALEHAKRPAARA